MMKDIDEVKTVKREFSQRYSPEVERYGYHLSCGITLADSSSSSQAPAESERLCIAARLQPMAGSPDPIEQSLLERITNEILPKEYKGVPVDVSYGGVVRARKAR